MEREYRNIYKSARETAGLTQERWAEVLGISADAVRKYEGGTVFPSDEVVLRMAEVCGQHIICYWHLIQKSRCAGKVLPDVKVRTLPEAVLNLLVKITDFSKQGLADLTRLASDGKISGEEVLAYGEAIQELRDVVAAAYELEYAEEAE